MKMHRHLMVVCCLAMLAVGAQAQTPADALVIKRATDLREGPSESARSVAPLALQSQVTRLGARQGPWIEVRTPQGASGWVHMFDAGTTLPAQGGSTTTGALRGITSFFGKGTAQPATTTATSTVGIRGLGAEDIANAQPNLEALTRVEAMRQTVAQARQFGDGATLVAVAVAPLPAPPPPVAAAGGAPGAAGSANRAGSDR